MSKRILALLLSSLMVLSAMPTAFAEEAETNSETESSVAEEVVDEEPTPEPTVEPTAEPTIVPTVEPTVEPTAEPTVEPTTTPEPTEEPKESEVVASGTCGDNLTWTLDSDGLLTISGNGAINSSAFDSDENEISENIISVVIEDGVTSIGGRAFEYCSSLTSVTIPDGVTSIGDGAFEYCSSLTSVTIPDGVTSIGNYAFEYCSSLTSVTIPDGVTSIGDRAFGYCTGLKTVTVGEGVASGETKLLLAFGGVNCEARFKLVISDGIFKIGNNAFESCSFITSVTIPDSVKTIGDSAFEYCSNLTNVKIPNSVKTIGDRAFYDCGWKAGGIGNLTIPDSVTKIGDEAFSCGITALLLPAKLPKISKSAFGYYGGYYPTTIYYKGSGKQWETVKKSLPYYSDTYWSNGTYKKRSIICNATHVHEYSTTKVTKATLNSNGKKYWKCKYCSKTKTSTVYKVASVKISDTTYLYNGSCKTPGVTVKNTKGTTLKKNTDYTVTYASGRREIGTYKVTVKFKGNYSGAKELTFKIVPKGTSLSSVSTSYKAFTAKWNLQKTQTSGYQIEYSTSSKFSSGNVYKTITKNTSSSLKVSGLKAKTKYYVRVRTYKLVNGTKVYSSWSSAKSVTTK